MKKFITVIAVLAMFVTLAACNIQNDKETVLVGVSMPTKTTERWIREGELMAELLIEAGYEVDLQFANDRIPDQISQIEKMITGGAKFLIICPIDGSTIGGALAMAKSRDIQVLSYDRLLMDTNDVDYFVGFDSESIGKLMGESLIAGIGADGASADDPLYIELFAGSVDDSNTPYYFEGAMEVIRPYIDSGKIIVKSGQTELNEVATPAWDGMKAYGRMHSLLSDYYTDDILAGVLSPYDGISLGIIGALKDVGYGTAGRPMPAVTGQDCEMPSLVSIMNNEQYSSIYLDLDLLARYAVDVARAMLEQTPIQSASAYNNGVKDVPAYLAAACELTKANFYNYFSDADLVL